MDSVKKYSCLIVDDEPPAREVLRRYISQLPILELAGECANALDAISALKRQQVDIMFLDIQMPQITGLDLIGTLAQPPKIVLTTAFEQYAVKAFELDVVDYLLKPIRFERFLKAVMKALPSQDIPRNMPQVIERTESKSDLATPAFLYFRADRKMVKVFLGEIYHIESLKDYIRVYTAKGTVLTKHTLAAVETMLPAGNFVRVHRSFIVAVDKIHSFTADELDVQGTLIPIGKIYRQEVLKVLNGQG